MFVFCRDIQEILLLFIKGRPITTFKIGKRRIFWADSINIPKKLLFFHPTDRPTPGGGGGETGN
jgi:hypothetical protein